MTSIFYDSTSNDIEYVKNIAQHDRFRCLYCGSILESIEIGSGYPKNRIKKRDGTGVITERMEQDTDEVFICIYCGWWYRKKINIDHTSAQRERQCVINPSDRTPNIICLNDISIPMEQTITQNKISASVGTLKTLSLHNISTPINEIKSYLVTRYEDRHDVHPKLYEEVVASVFNNLGYYAQATAYSRDGGIDVILQKDEIQIGVQVKRYRSRIRVSQVREFIGSLFLQPKFFSGYFVTTSDFTRGAKETAYVANECGIPIELIDSKQFLNLLRDSQKYSADSTREKTLEIAEKSKIIQFDVNTETYLRAN